MNRFDAKRFISGVYAITPDEGAGWSWSDVLQCVEVALNCGVRVLQMRQKNLDIATYKARAFELGQLCQQAQTALILNDAPIDPDLPNWPGVVGVHLGRHDLPLAHARSLWGSRLLIGASCYNQPELAKRAVGDGADYIAFGAVYSSSTKPQAVKARLDLFLQAQALGVPMVAIGGIQPSFIAELVEAGVDSVAVVSGLFGTSPNPIEMAERSKVWLSSWRKATECGV